MIFSAILKGVGLYDDHVGLWQYNPMSLMLATAISTSFSFMLPVGNPSNAIVFATKQITMMDMLSVLHMWGACSYPHHIISKPYPSTPYRMPQYIFLSMYIYCNAIM